MKDDDIADDGKPYRMTAEQCAQLNHYNIDLVLKDMRAGRVLITDPKYPFAWLANEVCKDHQ